MPIFPPQLPPIFKTHCCSEQVTRFVNQTETNIPWVGDKPHVNVMYLIGGVWQKAVSQITFASGYVSIDHGGEATGVVKIYV